MGVFAMYLHELLHTKVPGHIFQLDGDWSAIGNLYISLILNHCIVHLGNCFVLTLVLFEAFGQAGFTDLYLAYNEKIDLCIGRIMRVDRSLNSIAFFRSHIVLLAIATA